MNTKKLFVVIMAILLMLSCKGFAIATDQATVSPPNTKTPRPTISVENTLAVVASVQPSRTPTKAPTNTPVSTATQPNLGYSLIPFDYILKDQGDGWNSGRVSLAVENTSDSTIILREIELGEITIETMEGVTYMGQLTVSYQSQPVSTMDMFGEILIPPGFRFSKNSTTSMIGADAASWMVEWKSAIAATPTRITFSKQPQLSFALPSEQGLSISFPFDDANSPSMNAASSLGQTALTTSNSNLEVLFTGRCGNHDDFTSPQFPGLQASYFLEFVATNKDQFNQQKASIKNPMLFFYEDGRYVQQLDSYFFWDLSHFTPENEIDLGPGQTQTGYMFATGRAATVYSPETYLPPFAVLLDPNDRQGLNFRVFDIHECPNF